MSRIDSLDDDEIETPITEDADIFLAELEDLIDQAHVQYARATLESIMESVRLCGSVTEAQKTAISNIDEGGQRGLRRRRERKGYW